MRAMIIKWCINKCVTTSVGAIWADTIMAQFDMRLAAADCEHAITMQLNNHTSESEAHSSIARDSTSGVWSQTARRSGPVSVCDRASMHAYGERDIQRRWRRLHKETTRAAQVLHKYEFERRTTTTLVWNDLVCAQLLLAFICGYYYFILWI